MRLFTWPYNPKEFGDMELVHIIIVRTRHSQLKFSNRITSFAWKLSVKYKKLIGLLKSTRCAWHRAFSRIHALRAFESTRPLSWSCGCGGR